MDDHESSYRKQAREQKDIVSLYIARRGFDKASLAHAIFDAEIARRTTLQSLWIARASAIIACAALAVSILALWLRR